MRGWLLLAAAAAAAWAGCASRPSDETPPALPPFPPRGELIEFAVSPPSDFRFFIEAGSVSVGADGMVRYVLIARSPSGARNVSYEGMLCDTGGVRIYATGGEAGWIGKAGEWRAVEPRNIQRWHHALNREYFCPQREPVASAREALDALRRGGHPFSRGLSDDIPRGGGAR